MTSSVARRISSILSSPLRRRTRSTTVALSVRTCVRTDRTVSLAMQGRIDRRGFLGVGTTALICSLGGKSLNLRTHDDVRKADVMAAGLKRPAAARPDAVDALKFGTPQPQPGGQVREYWIQARTVRWDVAPTGRDDWMDMAVKGPRSFTALVYQAYSDGFAGPIGPAAMPGPTLEAEVGDVLRVHF